MSEIRRIAALESLEVMGCPPEPEFDRLARLAAHLSMADRTQICFIDNDDQWVLASTGVPIPARIKRSASVCQNVIISGAPLLIGEPHHGTNPVKELLQSYSFNSYVGTPIQLPEGSIVGVLAAFSYGPRLPSAARLDAFQDLSQVVSRELLVRRAALHRARTLDVDLGHKNYVEAIQSLVTNQLGVLRCVSDGVIVVRSNGCISFVNPAAETLLLRPATTLLGHPLTRLLNRSPVDGVCPFQTCLSDGTERLVRKASFSLPGQPPLSVEAIVTPVTSGQRLMGIVIIFRPKADNAQGNAMELRHTLREVNRFKDRIAKAESILDSLPSSTKAPALPERGRQPLSGLKQLLRQHQEDQLKRALALCDGRVPDAAALLGTTEGALAALTDGASPTKALSGEAAEKAPEAQPFQSRIARWKEHDAKSRLHNLN